MDQIEFLNEFIAAIDPSNPEAININTNLGEIPEWDSLAVLGVIVLFETMFNKKLTGEIIGEQKTVKEIYNLI